MIDMWYRCKRLVESASLASLCVHQHSWHPTSKDLGIAKTLNNLYYIAFTNEHNEAYPLVVTYIQLPTHTYKLHIHAFIHVCTYIHTTHTHTHTNIHYLHAFHWSTVPPHGIWIWKSYNTIKTWLYTTITSLISERNT